MVLGAGPAPGEYEAKAAPQLVRLEQQLDEQQAALKTSQVTSERYQAFERDFRAALAETVAHLELSPADVAAHARILSKLGQHSESLALVEEALKRHASDPSLLAAKGEALFAQGDYDGAAQLAQKAFDGSAGTDRHAANLLALFEGPSPTSRAPAGGSGSASPRGFKTQAPPPPAVARRPLDPRAPDYWDRQLLEPLLARSDANLVAREYLSPLIRAGKVTIRLERGPSIAGAWGTYDLTTSVITYNLDLINQDLREYNAYYARHDPGRVLAPVSPRRPLDAKQIEFLTGRFLPLAVHEAGGHGTHADALRSLLGTRRAPSNKDTELMAWRLEGATLAAERRRDAGYLTEPTKWARDEAEWMKVWSRSRALHEPQLVEAYLNSFDSYKGELNIHQDPENRLPAITAAVALMQSRCRTMYRGPCASAVSTVLAIFPDKYRAALSPFVAQLAKDPENGRLRAEVLDHIYGPAVSIYRLDQKGIAVVTEYYNREEARVSALETAADPRNLWEHVRSALRR